jgi:hypothetical protein
VTAKGTMTAPGDGCDRCDRCGGTEYLGTAVGFGIICLRCANRLLDAILALEEVLLDAFRPEASHV